MRNMGTFLYLRYVCMYLPTDIAGTYCIDTVAHNSLFYNDTYPFVCIYHHLNTVHGRYLWTTTAPSQRFDKQTSVIVIPLYPHICGQRAHPDSFCG